MQLNTLIIFSDEGAKEEDAYALVDVETAETSEPSFTVMVPRHGIEGRVILSDISPTDPDLKRDADKYCMTYKRVLSSRSLIRFESNSLFDNWKIIKGGW